MKLKTKTVGDQIDGAAQKAQSFAAQIRDKAHDVVATVGAAEVELGDMAAQLGRRVQKAARRTGLKAKVVTHHAGRVVDRLAAKAARAFDRHSRKESA